MDTKLGSSGEEAILAEQIAYYRARATEYDRWWYRTHQYELPEDRKAEWDAEVARLEQEVAGLRLSPATTPCRSGPTSATAGRTGS